MRWWTLVVGVAAAVVVAAAIMRAHWIRVRRERELLDLYQTLKEITSSPDVGAVLTTVAKHAAEALGALDGVLMIRSGDDLRAFSGMDAGVKPIANVIGHHAFDQDRPLPSVHVMRTGRALSIEDVKSYDGPPGFQEACEAAGVRSVLCAPILASSGVAGCLNLGFGEPNAFGPHEQRLATAYAEQASLGLERALVYELEQEALRSLRELDELRNDFISSASHELHTPLTSICGFSELLLDMWDEMTEDSRRGFLERIDAQAKQLAGLVDDLLDVGRLESGAVGATEPLDLRMMVSSALQLLGVGDRVVRMDIPDRVIVDANQAGCERVFFNLLTNAAKYSPPGSTITVRARTEGDEVVCSVIDEGVGIPEDEQEKIFERFYRSQRGDAGPRGTGLGLPIAKRYAEAMGGRIWVESHPGAGSTFSFTLRLAGDAARSPAIA